NPAPVVEGKETPMPLPPPVETLWRELEAVRGEVLREVAGLSQTQADWRGGGPGWVGGGGLPSLPLAAGAAREPPSKLLKDAGETLRPFPSDLGAFAPVPAWPPGPREAPPVVRPEAGRPIDVLLADMRAARERSRQSIERLGAIDPRPLTWR